MRTYTMGVIYGLSNAANPTPIPFGSLKNAKVGIKQEKAYFNGNQLDPIDVGNKKRMTTIDIETADFRAEALQLVIPGASPVAGSPLPSIAEQFTIPGSPFQCTVAQSALFTENAGVYDLTAGKWMTRGATSTGASVYAVAAGVYTFNTLDAAHVVLITYKYTPTSPAVGRVTTVSNAIQGQSVPFKLRLYNPWPTPSGAVRLIGADFYSVHFEELDLDFKVEDFSAHKLKGTASQDMLTGTLKTFDYFDSELG